MFFILNVINIFIVLRFLGSVSKVEVVAFFQDFKECFMILGGYFLQI